MYSPHSGLQISVDSPKKITISIKANIPNFQKKIKTF